MAIAPDLQSYFKPETQKNGSDIWKQDAVHLSIAADTQIQAFLKVSSGVRVRFLAESISSPGFTASCTCSSAKKGVLCKHIWATLLAADNQHPDFLDCKTEITLEAAPLKPESTAAKDRQAEYKKSQYEKQKQYAKQKRQELKKKKHPDPEPVFPPDVKEALEFFSENGFELEKDLSFESLKLAKKKLSRVFHPDFGGSHEEIVMLNKQSEVLLGFIDSLS